MKYKPLLLSIAIGFCSFSSAFSQVCHPFPKSSKFDTLSFIKTEVPTDSKNNKVTGSIYLGQGYVKTNNNQLLPAFIPSNRPTWAIAIAHSWNYHRNIIKRVNYPQIGYYLGTALQETQLACVTGTTWSTSQQTSPSQVAAANIMANSGCFQIEGPHSMYTGISQAFPNNRFPTDQTTFDKLVQSTSNFETSALIKSYYDIYTSIIFNYNMGWKFFESVDCTKDKYAYVKSTAAVYNGGANNFLSAKSFFDGSQVNNTNWTGLPATTAGYPSAIASNVSALEGDITYAGFVTGSSFDSYYNANITWTNVTDYLNIIKAFYPEINFTNNVNPRVQAAFEKIAGSTSTPIAFSKLGPVIDQIILALPAEYPTAVESVPIGAKTNCDGVKLPNGHIEIVSGATSINLGNSVTLKIVGDLGINANTTYKWQKDGVDYSTNQQITFGPIAAGNSVFTAQICNGTDCYQLNANAVNACTDAASNGGIEIKVTKSYFNNISILANATNASCKGINNGSVTLSIQNAPAKYQITYEGITSLGKITGIVNGTGNTVSIPNLVDGAYNFTLLNTVNNFDKAFANAVVGFTTLQNDVIDAKITSTANCIANLEASATAINAPCKWTVQAWMPLYLQWDNYAFLGVKTSTGVTSLDNWNRIAKQPEFDPWMDAKIVENVYYLKTGDSLNFAMSLNSTPGAVQNFAYSVRVLDNSNNVVKTFTVPANSAKANAAPYQIGSYKLTCPTTPTGTYNFTWNPVVQSQVNTNTKSTGNVPVWPSSDVKYTLTATNKTNATCVLTDTVTVAKNPNCVAPCTKPSKPTLTSSLGDSICEGLSTTLSVPLDASKYYVWYKDNAVNVDATLNKNSLVPTNNGLYKVRVVADKANKNNIDCYVESNSINFYIIPLNSNLGQTKCKLTGLENELIAEPKQLVKIYNLLGQEVDVNSAQGGVFIILYSDGSRLKVYR